MAKPKYTVEKYDPSDDPGKDGDWTVVARCVTKARAISAASKLLDRGYDWDLSICVTCDELGIDELVNDPEFLSALFGGVA
jgi:hypothetical protein